MYYRVRRTLSNILSGILAILIVAVAFFAINCILLNVVYIKTNVEGFSMVPTFNLNVETSTQSGDTVFINRFKPYSVGDVVVAEHGDKYIIKRLVGCPEDEIQIKDNGNTYGLYVNGELLYSKDKTNEIVDKVGSSKSYYNEYLAFVNNAENKSVTTNKNGEKCIRLNEGEYFLMGDNWGRTSDSLTTKKMFTANEIVGKVEIVIPYGETEEPYILQYMFKAMFN